MYIYIYIYICKYLHNFFFVEPKNSDFSSIYNFATDSNISVTELHVLLKQNLPQAFN